MKKYNTKNLSLSGAANSVQKNVRGSRDTEDNDESGQYSPTSQSDGRFLYDDDLHSSASTNPLSSKSKPFGIRVETAPSQNPKMKQLQSILSDSENSFNEQNDNKNNNKENNNNDDNDNNNNSKNKKKSEDGVKITSWHKENHNSKQITVEEAINILGFGRYQIILLMLTSAIYFASSLQYMLTPSLLLLIELEDDQSSSTDDSSNNSKLYTSDILDLTNLEKSLLIVGMACGDLISPIIGKYSDKFGRKKFIIISMLIVLIFGLLSSFSYNYIMLLLCRFFVSVGCNGCFTILSLFIEYVPLKQRGLTTFINLMAWNFGNIVASLIAWGVYANKNSLNYVNTELDGWRYMLLFSIIPICVLTPIAWWYLPESPRFLLITAQHTQCMKILYAIGLYNGTTLPANKTLKFYHENDSNEIKSDKNGKKLKNNKQNSIRVSNNNLNKQLSVNNNLGHGGSDINNINKKKSSIGIGSSGDGPVGAGTGSLVSQASLAHGSVAGGGGGGTGLFGTKLFKNDMGFLFNSNERGNIKDLFSENYIRSTVLLLCIGLIVDAIYYGISLFQEVYLTNFTDLIDSSDDANSSESSIILLDSVTNSDSSALWLNAIMSCSDIPATLLPIIFLSCISRKKMMIIWFFLSFLFFALFILFFAFDEFILIKNGHDILTELIICITLIFGGRMCISASMDVFELYILEYYPTVIRSTSHAFIFSFSSIAYIVSPFIVEFSDIIIIIMVYCVLSLIATIVSYKLPIETKHRKLEEKLNEITNEEYNEYLKTLETKIVFERYHPAMQNRYERNGNKKKQLRIAKIGFGKKLLIKLGLSPGVNGKNSSSDVPVPNGANSPLQRQATDEAKKLGYVFEDSELNGSAVPGFYTTIKKGNESKYNKSNSNHQRNATLTEMSEFDVDYNYVRMPE